MGSWNNAEVGEMRCQCTFKGFSKVLEDEREYLSLALSLSPCFVYNKQCQKKWNKINIPEVELKKKKAKDNAEITN